MNALYLDIFSGISGDMFLGAMIDLGVDVDVINGALRKIEIGNVKIEAIRKVKNGISGVKVEVIEFSEENAAHHEHKNYHHLELEVKNTEESHHHGHDHSKFSDHDDTQHGHHKEDIHHHNTRTYKEIVELIGASKLSGWVKERSVNIFARIARAEAKIHGRSIQDVHFHEVGAVDSIVDIVGACVALEAIGKPTVLCAPVVEGRGIVHCAHGNFPIPAPATLEILSERNITISQCDEPGEMVTPTGAAIIAEFAEKFGVLDNIKPLKIGYGLGTRDGKTRPNVLRAVLCKLAVENKTNHDWESDRVAVIETNLDDINSEVLGAFIEKALAAGALDIYYSPIQMKKNRPGVTLHVMCDLSKIEEIAEMIFTETTALGVRIQECSRLKLKRGFVTVETEYGEIRIKEGYLNNKVVQASPEFEDCKAAALRCSVPLKKVYEEALKAYFKTKNQKGYD